MSYLIPLTSKNVVPNGYNNVYRHDFPMSSVNFKDTEIAVHSISMYNSVFNIDSALYGNNTVQIKMPAAATTSTVTVTFQDGLYSYADITRYIQNALVAAGAYLINADGNYVHYIQITENATYYAAQVDCSPLPTSLPAGWSRPATGLYSAGGTGLPTTTRVPIFVINNAEFGKIVGYSLGEYPATSQTTLQSFLSNISPTVNPISNYTVRCSLINNPYSIPSDIICTFDNQGTASGQQITYRPNEHNWSPVSDGSYSSITVTITDQNSNFIKIRDTQVNITLALRQKN